MISIDSDLEYLRKVYQLNTQRVNGQNYKNVDELTEASAASASGAANGAAATGQASQISTSNELVQSLDLNDPKSRYAITENLSHKDMKKLMYSMDKDKLLLGLNFFTKDKLLQMISDYPKEDIIKILKKSFSLEQILKFMPEKVMNNFLQSKEIDKKQILAAMKDIDPDILQSIYEGSTGKSAQNMTKDQLLNSFKGMQDDQLKDGLLSLPLKQKKEFSAVLIEKNEKLMEQFPANEEGLMSALNVSTKGQITESMSALEPEQLINTLDKLPDELLSMVVTQIDPDVFADILMKNFPDIISQITG